MKFINSFGIEYFFFFSLGEKFLFLRIIFQRKRSTRHFFYKDKPKLYSIDK